jgi:hypothetical protein
MLRERGPLDAFQVVRVATTDRIAFLKGISGRRLLTVSVTGRSRQAVR